MQHWRREGELLPLNLFSSLTFSTWQTDKTVKAVNNLLRAKKRSLLPVRHGLQSSPGPMSVVLLHRCPPGRCWLHPVLRRNLCTLEFLGFLGLLGANLHLPKPDFLDLVVLGELGGTSGGIAPQIRTVSAWHCLAATESYSDCSKWLCFTTHSKERLHH